MPILRIYVLYIVKRCFIDCSEAQQTGDLLTYESIESSSTPEDTAYTSMQKHQHDYENVHAVAPVYSN